MFKHKKVIQQNVPNYKNRKLKKNKVSSQLYLADTIRLQVEFNVRG